MEAAPEAVEFFGARERRVWRCYPDRIGAGC
jgi:hypothetical protein